MPELTGLYDGTDDGVDDEVIGGVVDDADWRGMRGDENGGREGGGGCG
jgi:hypothetical protein